MEEERKNRIRRQVVSIASFALLIAFFVLIFIFVGKPMLEFVSEPEKFREWVDARGPLGRLAFLGMTVLQIVVAIIPGEPLEIGAGYAFGIAEGTALCLLGILIGSTAIWCFSHFLGQKAVEAFYPQEKLEEFSFLKNTERLNLLTFILFFIPGTPKDVLTYFIGLTPMKLPTFLLIAGVARLPSVITSVIGGSMLGEQKLTVAVIVFAVTGVISLLGILFYKKRFGKKDKK